MEHATVKILNTRFNKINEDQCVSTVIDRLDRGVGGWVITPNLDILRRYARDSSFDYLAGKADLVVADGMPVVWASYLKGTPLPGRVAGANLVSQLAARAAAGGKSLFLLGGDHGTAEASAEVLQGRHPDLRIAGTLCPPMGFERDARQMRQIRDVLLRARPDIVYVALGSPKQEWLIYEMRRYLPSTWWLGIGISFSFLSGRLRRAPEWMQSHGLEWAYRLYQDPHRLAKRYLVNGIPFAIYVLTKSLAERLHEGRIVARK